MNKKIIAIIAAVALVLVVALVATLVACNNDQNPEESGSQVELPSGEEDNGNGNGNGNGNTTAKAGDPGEYEYTACNETVYVSSSAATLRTADYEAKGSVAQGTALVRTGISKARTDVANDEAGYWSKVTYEGETYYVASKLLTDIKDPNEGFVEVNKTVVVNEKTGSLNIRSLPSTTGSEVIGYAIAGVEITVIAENTTSGWYKVQFVAYSGETMTGYIASDAKYFEGTEEESSSKTESSAESEANSESGSESESSNAGK